MLFHLRVACLLQRFVFTRAEDRGASAGGAATMADEAVWALEPSKPHEQLEKIIEEQLQKHQEQLQKHQEQLQKYSEGDDPPPPEFLEAFAKLKVLKAQWAQASGQPIEPEHRLHLLPEYRSNSSSSSSGSSSSSLSSSSFSLSSSSSRSPFPAEADAAMVRVSEL